MKLSPEQLARASSYSSAQELVDAAAQVGINCSIEQAEAFLRSNEMKELSEDDIELVSGGCSTNDNDGYEWVECANCPSCSSSDYDSYTESSVIFKTCKHCSKKWKHTNYNT